MCCYSDLVKKQNKLLHYCMSFPAHLDGNFIVRHYPAQTTIFEKNEMLSHVGILLSGQYRAVEDRKNGEMLVVEHREPVAFLGALACLANETKTACRFETLTSCEIAFIKVQLFNDWLMSDPHFYRALSGDFLNKMYTFIHSDRSELYFSSTKYLLFRYVLTKLEHDVDKTSRLFILNKTRSEISDETGLSVKTINRTIGKFVDDGAISIYRGKVIFSQTQYQHKNRFLEVYRQLSKNGRNVVGI